MLKKNTLLIINPRKDYLKDFVNYLRENFPNITTSVTNLPSPFTNKKLYGKKRIVGCILLNFLFSFRYILKKRMYDSVLLNGMLVTLPYLLLVRMFPFSNIARKIVVILFYIHSLGSNKIIQNILKLLLNNNNIILLVQSIYEKNYYSQLLDKPKIIYFPYCQGEILVSGRYGTGEEYIFAGGYTNRDYDSLFKAAEKINYKFIIICSKLNNISNDFPSNVKILEDVDESVFFSYLKNSKIVIVPLKEETGSSGQIISLAAMHFKKPIIYCNTSSLADYFDDGIDGICYRKGDAIDLSNKISYLLSNIEMQEKLGENAFKKYYESFHISNFYKFLSNLFLEES